MLQRKAHKRVAGVTADGAVVQTGGLQIRQCGFMVFWCDEDKCDLEDQVGVW